MTLDAQIYKLQETLLWPVYLSSKSTTWDFTCTATATHQYSVNQLSATTTQYAASTSQLTYKPINGWRAHQLSRRVNTGLDA